MPGEEDERNDERSETKGDRDIPEALLVRAGSREPVERAEGRRELSRYLRAQRVPDAKGASRRLGDLVARGNPEKARKVGSKILARGRPKPRRE